MDKLEEILNDLNSIFTNFGKLGSKTYTHKTLNTKEQTVNELINKAALILKERKENKQEIHNKIIELGKHLLEKIQNQREIINSKMAFDIKTATALLNHYDGKEDETETFLESIDLLNELTDDQHKKTMIKFIKTRITGRAKLALTEDIQTVDAIKKKLRQKFSAKLSSDAILSQLKSTQQGNKKLTDFIAQIENLSSQLTRAFIAENVANGEAAEKLAEKFANQSLVENVANPETSLILKATNYVNLSELAAKAISVDKPGKASILHFRNSQVHNNNYQQNWLRSTKRNNTLPSRPRSYQNNHNYNYQGQYNHPNRYNNYQNRFNNNYQSRYYNNYTSRPNNISSNSNRNNNWHNRMNQQHRIPSRPDANVQRVHYCNSGEYQPPQQDADSSQLGGQEQQGEYTT